MATRAPSGPFPRPDDDLARSAPLDEQAQFSELLAYARDEVSARLSRLLDAKLSETRELGADVEAMARAVRELTMRGGKRFRPALSLAAYKAIDEDAPSSAVLDAGVALELLQSYLLIHDDWMDGDDLRRGGPAVHVLLANHFGSQRAGEVSSILAGDFAAALALEALAQVKVEGERLAQAFAVFARMQQDAICGQQLDLSARPESIELMHELKTGSYTVRGPVVLGATLAGATPTQIAVLTRFARPLGIAFQLRDDLLGAFGSSSQTGKPVGSDIRAGKRTMLASIALERASASDRALIEATLGDPNASEARVEAIARIYESSGARRLVEARLESLVREAISELDTSSLSSLGITTLIGAARALTLRGS